MRTTMTAAVLAVFVLAAALPGPQVKVVDGQNVAFEVVSIKPHKVDERGARIGLQPGGRWVMVNVTTAGLIMTAYPSKTSELVGAPAWVNSERFDIDARAAFEPNPEQERTMLRALLVDRFKLAAHIETQERPVYNLVLARADRRLGPQLHRIDVDCATYKRPTTGGAAAGGAGASSASGDIPPCSYRMSGGATTLTFVSGGQTLESLGDRIAGLAGRPVIDKTGLAGYYAFRLEFGVDDALSVFTALQEQLGLKLEATRGPIDVVVIDQIERPTEN